MDFDCIGSKQPRRADPGEDVKIAHTEHNFGPAIYQRRPGH